MSAGRTDGFQESAFRIEFHAARCSSTEASSRHRSRTTDGSFARRKSRCTSSSYSYATDLEQILSQRLDIFRCSVRQVSVQSGEHRQRLSTTWHARMIYLVFSRGLPAAVLVRDRVQLLPSAPVQVGQMHHGNRGELQSRSVRVIVRRTEESHSCRRVSVPIEVIQCPTAFIGTSVHRTANISSRSGCSPSSSKKSDR